ncbi:MAG: TRAP transporter substrate-binding protein DctP [Clostridiales bacterium]|nr:TRAP transporter substrate-binding protein DctP [Clostridiales bacterium]
MKKLFSIALTAAMVMSLAACGSSSGSSTAATTAAAAAETKAEAEAAAPAAEETVTLTIAHTRPDGSSEDLAIKAFCEEAKELSGGTLEFEIYPASQLGDYTTVFERVMIGDVDMQCATVPTSVDKFFGLGNGAYIATTWDDAKATFASGTAVGNAMVERMENIGVKYINMFPFYFGGIGLGVPPVDPTNPDAKNGIKIRVPSMTSFEKTAEQLGYLGTPLPASEVFTSMQTGVVEGFIGYGAEGAYSNIGDIVKYWLPINDHFEVHTNVMNLDKFNSLSPKQQEAIMTAGAHMEANRWEVAPGETAVYEQKMHDEFGTEIIEFTDEELAAFASKIRANVWPLIREDFGGELFDQITEGKN